jgi:hypothetical protein
MGGANTGRSNKDEEVNPPEELRHTTPTTNNGTTISTHSALRTSMGIGVYCQIQEGTSTATVMIQASIPTA